MVANVQLREQFQIWVGYQNT